jgi:hypothetical protein
MTFGRGKSIIVDSQTSQKVNATGYIAMEQLTEMMW